MKIIKLKNIKTMKKTLTKRKAIKLDEVGVDNNQAIDVPISLRGREFRWNFDKPKMSLVDKITWVLTAVNVAILISLVM